MSRESANQFDYQGCCHLGGVRIASLIGGQLYSVCLVAWSEAHVSLQALISSVLKHPSTPGFRSSRLCAAKLYGQFPLLPTRTILLYVC